MEGRFINFYKSSDVTDALQLCEVKVYGGRDPVHHHIMIRGGMGVPSIGQPSLVKCPILLVLIAPLVEHGINTARVRGWFPTRGYLL